jgi:hypothetical protein
MPFTETQIAELSERIGRIQTETQANLQRAADAELELAVEREAHERTRAELAVHESRAQARAAAALEAAIEGLYAAGKLTPGEELEATLRQVAEVIGMDAFIAAARRLPTRIPVGRG